MKTLAVTAITFASLATTAVAQNNSVCFHGGLSYSVGSVIPIGSSARECMKADGGTQWVPQQDIEANCFFESNEYSRGSLIQFGDTLRICAKGAWFDKGD